MKRVTGTTSATPGTVTTHAHGLQKTPNVNLVWLQAHSPTGNTDDAATLATSPDGWDATNIAVKSNKASVSFTAFILLQDVEAEQAPASDL